jgi:release factor glutamine methyltransferase
VRDFEPRGALDGGPDGLRRVRGLIACAPAALRPGGLLLLEIGATQAEAVCRLGREAGFTRAEVFPDLADKPRFARLAGAGGDGGQPLKGVRRP